MLVVTPSFYIQWQIQDLAEGPADHGKQGARAYNRDVGAGPPHVGQGGPKAESLLFIFIQERGQKLKM